VNTKIHLAMELLQNQRWPQFMGISSRIERNKMWKCVLCSKLHLNTGQMSREGSNCKKCGSNLAGTVDGT
jgi:DNA-directed RNA polymerase subunit RPC12/RpoP